MEGPTSQLKDTRHEHATAIYIQLSSVRPRFVIAVFLFCASFLAFESLVLRTASNPIKVANECAPTSCSHTRIQTQHSHPPLYPSHPSRLSYLRLQPQRHPIILKWFF
jgi:hypothetical protein